MILLYPIRKISSDAVSRWFESSKKLYKLYLKLLNIYILEKLLDKRKHYEMKPILKELNRSLLGDVKNVFWSCELSHPSYDGFKDNSSPYIEVVWSQNINYN